MPTNVQVWDNSQITINFAGVEIDSDQSGGEYRVKVEWSGPVFTLKKGIGGAATRNRAYPSAKVTISLTQSAVVCSKLAAVLTLDANTPSGSGIAPLYVKDRNGNYTLVETQAFIEGHPNWEAGAEVGEMEWVVQCPDPVTFDGGH